MSVAGLRRLAFIGLFLFSGLSVAQTVPRILITKPVDESQLAVLKGNTHPLARAEFDRGAAPVDLPMNRMLLVLKRSDEQEGALRSLIDNQQDKASPNYHKWVTPEQFGKQFGPSDQDIAQVTSWLQSHGFQIAEVSKGRTVIEFSGTAAQVQEALHASIHKYAVNGEEHWANSNDPQIPAALTPVVAGVLTLHNFLKKPQIHVSEHEITARLEPAESGKRPQVTFAGTPPLHALGPPDYATIYNINPIINSGSVGNGVTIGVVGRSNLFNEGQDARQFDVIFWGGVPANLQVILNGPDPGDLGGGEEAEATLDATWSGGLATGATVDFVVSASTNTTDGVDLSELYIIDNNLTDIMTESFGGCEADQSSAEASAISSLAQQAAAEGITYIVSSGDSGVAGCDDPNSEATAKRPPSVNILASPPYTIAVGGTMFNENGQDSTYWSSGTTSVETALSYIPENAWNESCALSTCPKGEVPGIWAGGGGASIFYTKPEWQSGVTGIPNDGARDLPDVSLTAAGHDPYLICFEGSCVPDSNGEVSFLGISGTSASAPSFAGIMAMVDQKTGSRQGQANYVLYRLAAVENFSQCNGSKPGGFLVSTCVFNDVTLGNNSVPGDADYGSPNAKYQSSVGYDLATGLGSVNVTNLVNAWNLVTFNATTTTASLSPVNAVHGSAITVNVDVTANSGKPSGAVWLVGGPQTGNLVGDKTTAVFTLDATGSAAGVTHLLPGGTYQANAHYAGDGTYAPSDSSPVTVTIQPEPSVTSLSVLTKDQNGNLVPFTGGPYGTSVYFQAHVVGQSGYATPSSIVEFSYGNIFATNANLDRNGYGLAGSISNFSPGSYPAAAQYFGDVSFKPSSSPIVSFAITQAPTTISLTSSPDSQGVTLTAFISQAGGGNPPTGSITFYSGGTSLGTLPVTQVYGPNGTLQNGANFSDPQLPNGQYSMTASYNGDTNYLASTSASVNVSLQPDFLLSPFISTASVPPGQSGIFEMFVNYVDGFTGTITFSCSGLPKESSCSVPSVTSSGTIAFVTVTTTAPTAVKASGSSRLVFWTTTLGISFAGIFLVGVPVWRRPSNTFFSLILAAFLVAAIGCGGGSSNVTNASTTPVPQSDPGTPAGTYGITVTATSGALSHSEAFTLIVQ